MKKLLLYIAFVLMVGGAFAQSSLPACQGGDKAIWTNCFGTTTFANGRKYVGEFKDNKFHGQGTFTFEDGDKYVGEFKNNKRNGQGTTTYVDGRKYVGEYINDKANGQGTFYASDGSIINQGIWADGNFVRSEAFQQAVAPSVQQSNTPNPEILDPLVYIKELRKCIDIGASQFNKREAEEFVIDYKKYLIAEAGFTEEDINLKVKEAYKKIITIDSLMSLGLKPSSPELVMVCVSIEKDYKGRADSFYTSRGGKKKIQNNIALSDIVKVHKTNILKFNEMYKDTDLEILDGSIVFNKITFTNRTYYGNPALFGFRYWYDSFNECISDTNPAAGNNRNVCRRENIVTITNIAIIQQKSKIKIICQNSDIVQSEEDKESNMDILKNLMPESKIFLKKSKIKKVLDSDILLLENCIFAAK